jgi:hypothetical protein
MSRLGLVGRKTGPVWDPMEGANWSRLGPERSDPFHNLEDRHDEGDNRRFEPPPFHGDQARTLQRE